jgi:phage terminase small subunit
MNDNEIEDRLRLDAAKTAAQYCHLKKGDGGVKDEKQEAAKKAGAGKFGASAPPKLIVNNR